MLEKAPFAVLPFNADQAARPGQRTAGFGQFRSFIVEKAETFERLADPKAAVPSTPLPR
ncbi:hypothetical protein PTKU15_86740 [Paraburkholderia terrae]|nr:hypothetical protein PTKU15_86740 [Paraburkholderia terrae]